MPTANLQKSQKIEIKSLLFSLHKKPSTTSVVHGHTLMLFTINLFFFLLQNVSVIQTAPARSAFVFALDFWQIRIN